MYDDEDKKDGYLFKVQPRMTTAGAGHIMWIVGIGLQNVILEEG